MSEIDDGGPAFPKIEGFELDGMGKSFESSGGLTIRDYFAAKISWQEIDVEIPETVGNVANMMVGFGITPSPNVTNPYSSEDIRNLRQAIKYMIADAMIAARKAKS